MREQEPSLAHPKRERHFYPLEQDDGKAPTHPQMLALAQVSLLEGDLEEAVVLAEQAAGFDAFEDPGQE